MAKRAAVLTISDGVAAGAREDRSGAAAAAKLREQGFDLVERAVVPDEREEIARRLKAWVGSGAVDLILATGGTGLGPEQQYR